MPDEIAVLGIATSSQRGRVTVSRVIVSARGDELVDVSPLEAWQGTPRDEARAMGDLAEALANMLDHKRIGAPVALAVKRPEVTQGRPTVQYDQKTRAEGAAMIAAASQGRRYLAFRKSQLGDGQELVEHASQHSAYPQDQLGRDAVAVACTAIAVLLNESEPGD